jgi:hypothetical protein
MFGALINRMQKIQSLNVGLLFSDVINNELLQAQIIDLQQNQLYDQGIQSDGTPTGDYAPVTVAHYKPIAFSQGRDGRSDHITGKDTGITYASMKVEPMYNAFKITADDRNNFFETYEPKGLGLTTESIDEIKPEVLEGIIELTRIKIFS